jgi:hypothetical protein
MGSSVTMGGNCGLDAPRPSATAGAGRLGLADGFEGFDEPVHLAG